MSLIKNITISPKHRNLLLILLFLPVLFIDNRSSHDWGDDFAQYIHQSENIIKGLPQSETGFIYSQENYIGPKAYPAGFPLLLAPVYALFGNSMMAFTIWISIFYFFLAFLSLAYYRKYFQETVAIVLAILLIYNPQLLLFKQEVMSDIPFTVFLLIAVLQYPKLKPYRYRTLIPFSVLLAFIMMIRSVGFVLLIAILFHQFIELLAERKKYRQEKQQRFPFFRYVQFPVALAALSLLFYFIVNYLVFRIPSGGSLRDYLQFYYSGNFLLTIPDNLEHYVEVFRFMYTPAVGPFHFIALVTGSVFLTMSLLGFIKKMASKKEMTDWFFLFYILILLLFPNNYSAFRLLVPVGFILLYYAALGFKSIITPYVPLGRNRILILGVVMAVLFIPGIINVFLSRNTVLDGPQEKATAQAFARVQKLPDSSAVVFFKPRALALYTGKPGIADPFTQDPTRIHIQLMNNNAGYILIHNELTSESMKRYVRILKSRAGLIWKNKKYSLYKINPVNPAELY